MGRNTHASLAAAVVIFTLFNTASITAQTIIHVDASAQGAGNGSDWTNAFTTVGAAMLAAQPGDQVWVAAGHYVEQVQLYGGVRLYGGFAGTENPLTFDVADRDLTANVSILDGAEAADSVVQAFWEDAQPTRIDGFTITNGSATWGGGIRVHGVSPTIANNVITGNTASSHGGGVYLHNSAADVVGNTILANTAYRGGGVYYSASTSPLTANQLLGNRATNSGAGLYVNGQSPLVSRNVFVGNSADTSGGGITLVDSTATIANNWILGNGAGSTGGGILANRSPAMIVNTTITSNSSLSSSAAIYLIESPATIVNSIIAFNIAGINPYLGQPTLLHNCVFGNDRTNYDNMPDPTGNAGNISVDPQLVDYIYGNARIQATSPCVDAGTNAFVVGELDADGGARLHPLNGTVDIGAHESVGALLAAGPAIVVRVSPSGDDRNSGSTWQQAKRTVQAAMDTAMLPGGQVWVRKGTYHERINLRPYAHLLGGFNGSEMAEVERNPRIHESVLNGQNSGTVVTARAGYRYVARVSGLTITNGQGVEGGGMHVHRCAPTIENCTFKKNYSEELGGGLHGWHSNSLITGNTFVGNSSAANGGGLFMDLDRWSVFTNNVFIGNHTIAGGGGMYVRLGSDVVVSNCTFVGNTANTASGGMLIDFNFGPGTIANCIVAFNSAGIYAGGFGTGVLTHNCVFGNTTSNYFNIPNPTGTSGNISVNPQFVALPDPGPDETWGTDDDDLGDLRLLPSSPAVDTGDNTYAYGTADADGKPRIVDGDDDGTPDVDMGAYEYQPVAAPGDLDADGDVDLADFALWMDCFAGPAQAAPTGCEAADLNADGFVDLRDFALMTQLLQT